MLTDWAYLGLPRMPGLPTGLSFRTRIFHKVKIPTNKKLLLKTAGVWFKVILKDARAYAEGEKREDNQKSSGRP